MSRILIAGRDWQSRALLRAQLLEENFDVAAYETIPQALTTLGKGVRVPDLFIADISASETPSADVEALAAWSRKFPIWIIASHAYIDEKELRGRGFAMVLLRPLDVGDLVDQIKQKVAEGREDE